tara:strand:+ start:66340 stop:66504 length:165 start_codon:yes stop_codon:yes gene_type:complete
MAQQDLCYKGRYFFDRLFTLTHNNTPLMANKTVIIPKNVVMVKLFNGEPWLFAF